MRNKGLTNNHTWNAHFKPKVGQFSVAFFFFLSSSIFLWFFFSLKVLPNHPKTHFDLSVTPPPQVPCPSNYDNQLSFLLTLQKKLQYLSVTATFSLSCPSFFIQLCLLFVQLSPLSQTACPPFLFLFPVLFSRPNTTHSRVDEEEKKKEKRKKELPPSEGVYRCSKT